MNGQTYILTVLTPDHRGIIAAITSVLATHDAHLLELSQTVVRDYFTIIVVLTLAEPNDPAVLNPELTARLGPNATVTLVPYRAAPSAPPRGERYILTATGNDSPGILPTLSEMVANRGGNFTDLGARVIDGKISIIAEIEVPGDIRLDQFQIDLQHAGSEAGLRVRLQHNKLFVATNEVAFRRISNDS